ncbi:hypothetical protein K1719_010970 [Acacia pycnantha]|nr:hypothetical protein K1719_010970 [Acacia pycnantha]
MKELEVAIGEASSIEDARGQNQSQPQTLRKRGRPRKIVVEKTDGGDQLAAGVDAEAAAEESLEKALEKNKSSEELEGREFAHVDSSSACTTWITKEDGVSSQEVELFRSRKARRKSKPRKSC